MICRLHSPVESLESAPTDVQQSFLSKIISCPHKSFAVFRVLCVAAGRAFGCFIHFNKTLYQRWKSIKNQQKNNTIGISPPSDRILSHDLLSSSSQYSYCADWQAKTREVVLSLHLRMKWRRKDPWNRNWIKLINFRLYQQSTCSTTTTFRFPFSPWWIIWPPRRTRPLNWTLQNINKYVYPFRFPSFLYKKKNSTKRLCIDIFLQTVQSPCPQSRTETLRLFMWWSWALDEVLLWERPFELQNEPTRKLYVCSDSKGMLSSISMWLKRTTTPSSRWRTWKSAWIGETTYGSSFLSDGVDWDHSHRYEGLSLSYQSRSRRLRAPRLLRRQRIGPRMSPGNLSLHSLSNGVYSSELH